MISYETSICAKVRFQLVLHYKFHIADSVLDQLGEEPHDRVPAAGGCHRTHDDGRSDTQPASAYIYLFLSLLNRTCTFVLVGGGGNESEGKSEKKSV